MRRSLVLCGLILLLDNLASLGQIRVEALVGEPFGVARITIPAQQLQSLPQDHRHLTSDSSIRPIFYPVILDGRWREPLGEFTAGTPEPKRNLQVFFLFQGDEPFDISFGNAPSMTISMRPTVVRPRPFQRALMGWWRAYHANVRQQLRHGDFPSLIHDYLTGMLGRRLGLRPPLLSREPSTSSNDLAALLDLLFGTERLRSRTLHNTLRSERVNAESAIQRLPETFIETDNQAITESATVDIEPIAQRVPRNCFYVRFGQFSNFLWLEDLLQTQSDDLETMLTVRGHDAELSKKLQTQLSLQQTALTKLLGDQFISDVALLGRDMFLREGAALGILLEARNPLLGPNFRKSRAATLAREQANGATLQNVTISDQQVSLLKTPDNRIRSYYAVDGKYHLFTTCREIVEAFFATRDGAASLGNSRDFIDARSRLPINQNHTLFVFLSADFLEGLLSPHYQVELARRIQAVTDLEAIQLAQWTARNEKKPHHSLEDLVLAGFLPAGITLRADGSGPLMTDSTPIDSLRGPRGYFTPIPDVSIQNITASEARNLWTGRDESTEKRQPLDPLVVGVRRFSLSEGQERLVIDANILPLDETKYGKWLSLLGPLTRQVITPPPESVITLQASLRGGLLFPKIPPHLMFLSVLDIPTISELAPARLIKVLELLRTTPGMLGSWPNPGLIDSFPLDLDGTPDAAGYSRLPFGIWRRQTNNGFSVLAMDRDTLAQATPHLQITEAEDPAHMFLHIGNLSRSHLHETINTLSFQRALLASRGNVQLFTTLSEQLGVPVADAATVAENLLGVKLLCALGGEYQLSSTATSLPHWTSTHWPTNPQTVPEKYQSPFLTWFRGLEGSLVKYDGEAELRLILDIQSPTEKSGLTLPLFDFFRQAEETTVDPRDDSSVDLIPAP